MKGNTTAEERKNREAQRDSYKAANWAFVIKMTPNGGAVRMAKRV